MIASPRPARLARFAAVAAAALLTVGALSACTSASTSKTPKPTSTSGQQNSTKTPSASPTPTPTPTPVTFTCDQVLTAQQLYDFNPNLGTDPGYSPKSGSKPAQIVKDKGIACGWLNQTSKSVIEVAVEQPAASTLTDLKNKAITTSKPVPTYGIPPEVEAYFTVNGGAGEAQIFTGAYWIVVSSTDFAEPGDPAPLIQSLLGNLPKS